MKTIFAIFTLLIVAIFSIQSFSQNIAINQTGAAANASAILDVNATNKGILIPNVAISNNTDGTTISSPATSLLVYNTNASMTNGAGKGYYYNSGTPASPVWINLLTPTTASTSGSGDWTLVGVASSTAGFSGFVTTGYTTATGKEYLAIVMAGGSPTMSDAVAVYGPIQNNGVAFSYVAYVTLFSPVITATSAEGWAIISGKLKNASIATTANIGVNGTFGGGANDPVIAIKGNGEIGYNDIGAFNAYSMYLFER